MKSKSKNKRLDVKKMTVIGVLGAISIILGLTPLGFIPIGPTKATIMHIPVLIGSILEGPVVGMFIGLIFGLFSMFQALTNPTPVSFVFLNPIIAILPRVFMGYASYYIYDFFTRKNSSFSRKIANIGIIGFIIYLGNAIRIGLANGEGVFGILLNLVLVVLLGLLIYYLNRQEDDVLGIILASAVGTLINTLGVLSLIYFLYGERFVSELGKNAEFARNIIFSIGITNGIPEVILAVVITVSVVKSLNNNR